MAVLNPIYEGIRVKKDVVELIKTIINDDKFYKQDKATKQALMMKLNNELSEMYGLEAPKLILRDRSFNHYRIREKTIVIQSLSFISFLHEYRHFLQHEKGLKYEGMTIEQDARAWSMRAFKQAVPKMFEKAVKEGKVCHIKWCEEQQKIVDNARYI